MIEKRNSIHLKKNDTTYLDEEKGKSRWELEVETKKTTFNDSDKQPPISNKNSKMKTRGNPNFIEKTN